MKKTISGKRGCVFDVRLKKRIVNNTSDCLFVEGQESLFVARAIVLTHKLRASKNKRGIYTYP